MYCFREQERIEQTRIVHGASQESASDETETAGSRPVSPPSVNMDSSSSSSSWTLVVSHVLAANCVMVAVTMWLCGEFYCGYSSPTMWLFKVTIGILLHIFFASWSS